MSHITLWHMKKHQEGAILSEQTGLNLSGSHCGFTAHKLTSSVYIVSSTKQQWADYDFCHADLGGYGEVEYIQ